MSFETKAKRSKTIKNSRFSWDISTPETKLESNKETKTFTSKNTNKKRGRKKKEETVETTETVENTTEDKE